MDLDIFGGLAHGVAGFAHIILSSLGRVDILCGDWIVVILSDGLLLR